MAAPDGTFPDPHDVATPNLVADRRPGLLRATVREARPKQWAKNLLVFAAPGAAGVLDNGPQLWRALLLFAAFCAVSSGTYFVNDILDVEADRIHPIKRNRPIASGALSVGTAWMTAALLIAGGLAMAFFVRWQAGAVTAGYVLVTASYSIVWKHVAVVDLVAVAAGFVIRAIAGAAGVDVPMSRWFLLCTSFGSLFIVTGKRYAELRDLGEAGASSRATLDAYSLGYLRIVLSVSIGATLVTYCIWAFDITATLHVRYPFYQLSIVPMVTAILRYMLILEQGHGAAPEEIFIADRALQILGGVWVIVFGLGVYLR